jgi:hypothetical protein
MEGKGVNRYEKEISNVPLKNRLTRPFTRALTQQGGRQGTRKTRKLHFVGVTSVRGPRSNSAPRTLSTRNKRACVCQFYVQARNDIPPLHRVAMLSTALERERAKIFGGSSRLLASVDSGLDRVDLEAVLLLDPLPPALLVSGGLDVCYRMVSRAVSGGFRRAGNGIGCLRTSALSNVLDGFLDRHPRRPPDDLLALELVLLLLVAVDAVAEHEERALEGAEGGSESQHRREALDCSRHHQFLLSRFRRGWISGDNLQGRPRMLPAAKPPRATDQASSFSRRLNAVRDTKQYAVGAAAIKKKALKSAHVPIPTTVEAGPRTSETDDGRAPREDAKGADVGAHHGVPD